MKKQLIAAAVAGAFVLPALAQNVEIYGVLDAGVVTADLPTDTNAATTFGGGKGTVNGTAASGVTGGANATVTLPPGAIAAGTANNKGTVFGHSVLNSSRWGIRGSEDLGGGLRAVFNFEGDVELNNGTTHSSGVFRRAAWVGVSSKDLGELSLGLRLNPLIATNGALMPVAGNIVSTLTGAALGYNDFFTRNALTYTTPNMGGLVVQLQTGFSQDTESSDDGSVRAGSAAYSNGPVQIRAAMQQRQGMTDTPASGANGTFWDSKAWIAGIRFQATPQLSLAAAYHTNVIKTMAGATTQDLSATQMGVGYQMSPTLLLGAVRTTGEGATMTNMQVRYTLSKRTFAYLTHNMVDNSATMAFAPVGFSSSTTVQAVDGCIGGGCGIVSAKQTATAVGLSHNF
jgi:predicted porin